MDTTATLEEIGTWAESDQLELVFEVWDRLLDKGWKPTVTPELEAELKRRIAAHDADQNGGHTWEEVLAHLRRPR